MPTKSPSELPKAPKPVAAKSASLKAEPAVVKPGARPNGEALSVAGFTLALASIFTNIFTLGIMALVALVLSIMGFVQAKKSGRSNNLGLAGIIISGIVMALTFIGFIFLVVTALIGGHYGIDCSAPYFAEHELCQPLDAEPPTFNAPEDRGRLFDLNGV